MTGFESRVQSLRWLYEVTVASIEGVDEEKRAPLIAQARAIVAELADLGVGASVEGERTGLLDFQSALAQRKPDAPPQRRSSR